MNRTYTQDEIDAAVQAERERAAKAAEDERFPFDDPLPLPKKEAQEYWDNCCETIARKIREGA